MTTPTPQPRKRTSSTVGIITAIVGGIVIVLALVSVGIAALVQSARGDSGEDRTLTHSDLQGITAVNADAGAATFTVVFDDVAEAQLEIIEVASNRWTLERRGDTLFAESNAGWFGGFCLFGCFWPDEQVTLTLPEELNGKLSADLTLSSGAMYARGDFVALDLEVSAGQLTAEGSARSVESQVSAGRMDLTLENVREAAFEVSAGKIDAELSGTPPQHIDIDVSAGGINLMIPDRTYRVQSDVSAGTFTNNLRTDPAANNTITVEVSAGEVILDSAR